MEVELHTKLVIKCILHFVVKPRAQIVKQFGDNYEGSEAITKCSSTGFPKPILKWRKLLGSLPSTASVSDDGQTLTIKSLRKADSGTYVCSASSELGSSEVSTVLYAASSKYKLNVYHNFFRLSRMFNHCWFDALLIIRRSILDLVYCVSSISGNL